MADARPDLGPHSRHPLVPAWVVVAVALAIVGLAMAVSGPGDSPRGGSDNGGAGNRFFGSTAPPSWTPVDTATTVVVQPGPRLVVKFADGSGVRLLYGELVSLSGADLGPVDAVLARHPGSVVEPLLARADDLAAALGESTGDAPPELSLYYRLTLPAGTDADTVLADLDGLAAVDWAYAEP